MKAPYELLYGHPPNYSSLRTFGCHFYVSTVPIHRLKLDPRSIKCAFFGYPFGKGDINFFISLQIRFLFQGM